MIQGLREAAPPIKAYHLNCLKSVVNAATKVYGQRSLVRNGICPYESGKRYRNVVEIISRCAILLYRHTEMPEQSLIERASLFGHFVIIDLKVLNVE